ncbi:hypothetical protein STRIC_0357 [Streptococcus ictaluri 707-05]|uniref:Uncharacterized protein n=1 Tax=Streptococcus ictaluri 707-05 TaxID=764299 RepID=G5K180_9STRE|nr:hypothetical protein STRIC_0357 [Streptococcus ictaluri 707-05]
MIESQNLRAFGYAQEALQKVISFENGRLYLPIVSVKHLRCVGSLKASTVHHGRDKSV